MCKILSIFFVALISTTAFSQDTMLYKVDSAQNKFVYKDNTIKLFAGQQIIVSARQGSEKIKSFKLKKIDTSTITDGNLILNILKHSDKENLCIDFNVVKDSSGKWSTILVVRNPYGKKLGYKAKMFNTRSNSFVSTSIWDVQPRVVGLEHWPYAIPSIILYDFTLKD